MTPAIEALRAAGIAYTIRPYDHDPASRSFGREAAEKLGVDPERVFKTLIVALESRKLCAAIVPVARQLNMKSLAKAAGGKKAAMAEIQLVERTTGYVMGGVSPVGQKRSLPAFIDSSATEYQTIYVSAGKRGLDIEISPRELIELINAKIAGLT